MHPDLSAKAQGEVFAHEFGHAVLFAKVFEMSDRESRAIFADYAEWKGGVKTVQDVMDKIGRAHV